MYKELKESEIKTCTQIMHEHPRLAYIMLNPEQPFVNGITLESRGSLYAIADEEGLGQLYETADKLESEGHSTLIDTIALMGPYTIPSCWPVEED